MQDASEEEMENLHRSMKHNKGVISHLPQVRGAELKSAWGENRKSYWDSIIGSGTARKEDEEMRDNDGDVSNEYTLVKGDDEGSFDME